MLRLSFLSTTILFSSTMAFAEPLIEPGTCELQVKSTRSLSLAQSYIRQNYSDRRYAKIFAANNGWYAVSIGSLQPHQVDSVISSWISSGEIPDDSFCSYGDNYIARYSWQTGEQINAIRPSRPRQVPNNSSSGGMNITGTALGLLFGGLLGQGSSSSNSSNSGQYTSSLKYGCQFVCEGQFGFSRSETFTVNTPYTNGYDALEYVRREYKGVCNQYPFYGDSGTGATVGYPSCETYYYDD